MRHTTVSSAFFSSPSTDAAAAACAQPRKEQLTPPSHNHNVTCNNTQHAIRSHSQAHPHTQSQPVTVAETPRHNHGQPHAQSPTHSQRHPLRHTITVTRKSFLHLPAPAARQTSPHARSRAPASAKHTTLACGDEPNTEFACGDAPNTETFAGAMRQTQRSHAVMRQTTKRRCRQTTSIGSRLTGGHSSAPPFRGRDRAISRQTHTLGTPGAHRQQETLTARAGTMWRRAKEASVWSPPGTRRRCPARGEWLCVIALVWVRVSMCA